MGIITGSTVQTSLRFPVDLHNHIKDIGTQQHDTFTDVLLVLARLGLQKLESDHKYRYWEARAATLDAVRKGEIH